MKSISASLVAFLFLFSAASMQALDIPDGLKKIQLTSQWYFHKGDASSKASNADFDHQSWEKVSIPHTYELTSINLNDSTDDKFQETFHRDVSWYRKKIDINATVAQRVYLVFEGAYQKTELWVNGKYVGEHAVSAYTPFHFDITAFINPGRTNTIALRLDNRKNVDIPPDGHSRDYVLFGGLYRDVYLHVKNETHMSFPWESRHAGVTITTPSVNEKNATVSIETEVKNTSDRNKTVTVQARIIDADNRVVKRMQRSHSIAAHSHYQFIQTTSISNDLQLWSIENPYLYRVLLTIKDENGPVDIVEQPLGFRWFEFRLNEGFLLNGKPLELIGANRHQHYPYIGDAVPNNLHRADAIKFKRAGMNVVRLAHYPHDDSFFDACDELGILLMEEPPSWIEFGSDVFMSRMEEALRRTIRAHKNHPSVVGWGAGINHRGAVKRLHYAAKEEDPNRITMNNGTLWTGTQNAGVADIYAVMDYRGAVRPENELLFAMEHSASEDSQSLQKIVSKYKGDPNLIGLAAWSAHESYSFIKRDKRYPNLSRWRAASWNIFRWPKPNFYWYQSEMTDEPMVHIPDVRAQKQETIQVFTNTDEVALFHNKDLIAKKSPSRNEDTQHVASPSVFFDVKGKGVYKAVAYNKVNGKSKRVAEHSISRGTSPHRLQLVLDSASFDSLPLEQLVQKTLIRDIDDTQNKNEPLTIPADSASIVMAYAVIKDKNGFIVDTANNSVRFEISGDADIIGDQRIGANPVEAEFGVAPLMVRVGDAPGKVVIAAHADGLESAEAEFSTRPWSENSLEKMEDFFEPIHMRIDLGNTLQHVQDEWMAWSNEGRSKKTRRQFVDDIGRSIDVALAASADSDMEWTHSWGVPGELSFMIEDGVTVKKGRVELRFSGLPEGRYRLRTWHHVLSGKKKDVPPLTFELALAKRVSSNVQKRLQPTFGSKIQVSTAGGGGKGDGGSNKGANGYAEMVVDVSSGVLTLAISKASRKGVLNLNGFELYQLK